MNVGNLFLRKKLGALPPTPAPTCDAQVDPASYVIEDVCGYANTADVIAGELYNVPPGGENNGAGWTDTTGLTLLTTDAPWNGKQSLRLPDPCTFTTHLFANVADLWFRMRVRFSVGAFDDDFGIMQLFRYSAPGNMLLRVVPASSGTNPNTFRLYQGWSGTDNYPALVRMDDYEWWDIIMRINGAADGSGLITDDFWVRHSLDHSNEVHVFSGTEPNGTDTEPWIDYNLNVISPFPSRTMDVGSFEFKNGALGLNPFGVTT